MPGPVGYLRFDVFQDPFVLELAAVRVGDYGRLVH